ncbi:unnamed protein product [Rhizoctonia solani]|uniref:FR47-like protein n=1 Tax=Rhizoctonia solani TaxID=456999 RepID=A0A8H3A1L2_9AGAM|nr:GNAT family acetyltransferase [Rhizoctonia solani]KAF8751136.1 FR47-like protein [Rhizoctonia solani]QRW21073.1 GNAT family acetyltransferase [Rhizoctonia solani]CAE6378006.1 unnamed protein product [Rhizoctonia solani]
MAESSNNQLSIRIATLEDIKELSRICLLTANAGQSAESLHHYPELLQGLYIEPYLKLTSTFGFVLVDTVDEGKGVVLGYLLATSDSRRHEAAAEQESYPPLRIKYPNNPYPSDATERDQGVINRIHKPLIRPQALVDISPAHIHINLLPSAQRQGWGVKLIDQAVKALKAEGQSALFVGIDSKNHNARAFYLKVGFKPFPFPDKEYLVLHFQDWKGARN